MRNFTPAGRQMFAFALPLALSLALGAALAARQPLPSAETAASAALQTAPPVDLVEVNIKNLTFIPDPVIIKVGQTVRWTNNDDRDYQIMAKDRSFQSPNLRPKEKFEHQFTEAGKFDYFDVLRPRVMGTVEVNAE